MFIPAAIIPPIGRGVTVLTYCALTMAGWNATFSKPTIFVV
jgi:hypothetical protein